MIAHLTLLGGRPCMGTFENHDPGWQGVVFEDTLVWHFVRGENFGDGGYDTIASNWLTTGGHAFIAWEQIETATLARFMERMNGGLES